MKALKKKQSGFTMIEIMVVVVIVAILAAIALPIYLDYVQSSYASEARTVMSNVHNAAKMYYQTKGEWPGDVEQLERAGQLDLDRSTKLKWTFELQLPDRLSATSTEEMQGGAGKVVSFDVLTGKFQGYGSPDESQQFMDLNELLSYSIDSGASDLHLSVGSVPMVRINGTMKPLNVDVLKQSEIEKMLPEVMNEDQLKLFKDKKEIDFSAKLEGKGRFRVNFFNQINGLAGVFRTIPDTIKSCDELGIPPFMQDLAMIDRGLVLLTGPTGSGKSTTLAAMVDHINREKACHIITIEDPVEYYHHTKESLINQRELGASTHSFANALKSALREDPDVILVGEMRDLETISLALTAAETGHLVLSTLHTSSAVKAIDRIIDCFPAL